MDIRSLLSPCTVSEFGETWNKRSRVFLGRRDRFADLAFDHAALKSILRGGQLPVKAQYIDPDAGHTEIPIDPGRIQECFAQGMTICVQNIDKMLPKLAQQLAVLKRSMHFPGIINFSCYWSPQSGGFDLHCDDHPVFILQIKGKKKWHYCATSAVDRVFGSVIYSAKKVRDLRAIGLEIRDPDKLESVTLMPGDMLYLPAGTWHKTCAMNGESIGLTLRCFEGSAFDLVQSILDKHLTMNKWHEMLPLIDRSRTDPLSAPSDLVALFGARLGELKDFIAGLTVTDLAQIWAERFVHPSTDPAQRAVVAADDQLLVNTNAVVLRSNDRDTAGAYWVHNGQVECKLSLSDSGWFESIMRVGSFTAAHACHWGAERLSWETAKSWLEELIDVGLVHPSGKDV
jgi:ribosomal protein L16 Arg81 hydroxylase